MAVLVQQGVIPEKEERADRYMSGRSALYMMFLLRTETSHLARLLTSQDRCQL